MKSKDNADQPSEPSTKIGSNGTYHIRQTQLEQAFYNGQKLELNARSANTLKRYRNAFRLFEQWCQTHEVETIPLYPEAGYAFLAHLHTEGYAATTIMVIKSAIDYAHQLKGLQSPLNHPRIKTLLQGIRRDRGYQTKSALPLTFDLLRRVLDSFPNDGLIHLRDRALLLTGFSGGMRVSELIQLTDDDIEFKENQGMLITISHSKTDQMGQGHTLAIPFNRQNSKYCPVTAITNWMDASAPQKQSPTIFNAFYKGAARLKHTPLSYDGFYKILKKRCQHTGLDAKTIAKLTPHSLRSGFNTSAAMAGADLIKMREITNQTLNTQQRYIKKVNLFTNNANEQIYQYFGN